MRARRARLVLPVLLFLLALGSASRAAGPLRVGTSGDYAPFSVAEGEAALRGFDVAVARAYAGERGLELEFVRFRWPELATALAQGRFDLAMSGVTVRPERSAIGRFSVPVAETGAVLLVRQPERWETPGDLDRRGIRIGVNAGGHLERVARARFRRATVVSIPDNAAVRAALLELSVDAAVTDTLEVGHWLEGAEGLGVLGPFTLDRKAYLVRPERAELAADLDAWLLDRERDGTLAALRAEHLGETAAAPVATPLGSLLAAIDERLAMMPLVGAAKREAGLPLEVPEREALVLDAAVAGVRDAAARAGAEAPPETLVRALFRAQIEAAKQVQWAAVRDPEFSPPRPLPDLDAELRPGLLRVGERIAALLLVLPADLGRPAVRAAARGALRTPWLSERRRRHIADAIADLSAARTE